MQKTVAALTGMAAEDVLTPAQIKSFESGSIDLAEVAELARKNSKFAKHLANFWTEKFQILESVQWQDNFNLDRATGCNSTRPCNFVEEVTRFYGEPTAARRQLRYSHTTCRSTSSDDDMTDEGTFLLTGALSASHEDYTFVVNPAVDGECFGRTKLVTPWWSASPADYIRVGSKLEDYCGGPGLPECLPRVDTNSYREQGHYSYHGRLRYGFTMQPGMMVAMQTQELKPWANAVTTSKVPVNGTLADFLHRFDHNEDVGTMQFFKFPGAYPAIKTDPVFTKANPQGADDWKWVEQGLPSGVLSTFAFHRVTDGRRAKFNRMYNSMLCLEFNAFPDTVPDPKDVNPDLTKRSGCKDCHAALEPAAKFFANWPELGNSTAYFYSKNEEDQGVFLGQSGSGTPGLAGAIKDSIPFHSCGVQRSFEFVMGREMSLSEKGRLMPSLLRVYQEGDKKLWPVIKHILSAKYFTEGK